MSGLKVEFVLIRPNVDEQEDLLVLQMLIFFYDMSNRTEIALDENMTGLIVTFCTASRNFGLLFF